VLQSQAAKKTDRKDKRDAHLAKSSVNMLMKFAASPCHMEEEEEEQEEEKQQKTNAVRRGHR
jgi:hypothetical protein